MENSEQSQNEDPNRKTDQIYDLIREFLPDVNKRLKLIIFYCQTYSCFYF